MKSAMQNTNQDKPPEIIAVDHEADGVSCDGGGGALGHPKVWYTFEDKDVVECGYCDRRFVKPGA
jgi:uncharacterized Zn-finger protein